MSDTLLSDLEAEDITNHFDSLPPDQQPVARNRLRAYFDEKDRRRAEAFRSVESLMLDAPEDFAKSNPAAVKPLMQPDDWDETRELAGLSTLTGADPRRISKAPGAFRAAVADSWGQPDIATDVPKFRARLKAHFQKSRDTRLLGEDIDTEATRAELIRDAALTPEMITANASDIPSWEKWSFTAPGKPGFDQSQTGAYFAKWAAAQERVRKLTAPLRGQINEAWTTISGDPNAGEVLGLADVLSQMPTKDRKTVLWAIQQRAEAMPEAQKKQFWDRAGRAFLSSLDQMLTGMATGPERIGDMVFRDFGASPEDRAQLRKRQDTLEELRSLQTSKLQPFESSDDGLLAKVGLGAMQSAPALAAAFAGPVGWYGIGAQMADESRAAVRPALEKALQAQGLDADQADERAGVIAEPLAIAAGAINTAVEKLTFGMATGIPGVRGLQAKLIAATSESLAKRIALRGAAFALEAGEQQLQEAVQDAMPFALADAAKVAGVDLPDFVNEDGSKSRWITEAGRVFGKTALDPTTLGVSLLFAAGGFGHVDGVTLAEGLRREGVESSAIEQVLSAAPEQRAEAAIAAIEAVPPEAKAAAKEAAATQDAAAKAAGVLGVLPTFRVNPDGIGVFLDGQHIGTAPTVDEAMQVAAVASEQFADMDADQTALLASMLETADVFATQEDAGKVAYIEVSPNRRTVAQQLAESAAQGDTQTEARLREEIRLMAEAEGVDPATLILIAGDNVTTFQNGVAYSVSRVFDGASPLTVVHETAHGSFKAGLRNGVFTRAGTIKVVRGVEQVTGQKFFQSTDDKAIGEAELEETVMQLAEAEVLRRRKRGDALAPGAITKGIAAYIRQEARSGAADLKEALSFKHFMSAVRRTMKVVFSRALALRKAQAEGKLGDDYHSFLNKLLGVDTQISHEEAVSQAALDYVPPTAEQEAAGMAFSVGGIKRFSAHRKLKELTAFIKDSGIPYNRHVAATGSAYFLLQKGEKQLRVRIGDHSPTERLSNDLFIDPFAYTFPEGRAIIADYFGLPFPESQQKPKAVAEWRAEFAKREAERAARQPALEQKIADAKAEIARLEAEIPQWKAMGSAYDAIVSEKESSLSAERAFLQQMENQKPAISDGLSEPVGSRLAAGADQNAQDAATAPDSVNPSFALAPAGRLSVVEDRVQKALDKDPELKRRVFTDIRSKLARLANDWSNLRWTPKGDRIEPIAEKRSAKSLAKEQAFREATRAAELEKLYGDEQRARDEAKAEAAQWRKEADAAQKRDHSPKAAMLRDLVTLDAMLTTLPPEVRAKVGGYVSIARLGTDASRLAELQKRADMIGREMEAHLARELRSELSSLRKKAVPDMKAGQKPKGKIGAEAHRYFNEIARVIGFSEAEIEGERTKLDTMLADDATTPEQAADIFETQQILDTFGGIEYRDAKTKKWLRDSVAVEKALAAAKEVYEEGRNRWRAVEEARLAGVKAMASEIVELLGGPSMAGVQRSKADAAKFKQIAGKSAADLFSFGEVLRFILGDSNPIALRWEDAARNAKNARIDMTNALKRRWRDAIESATGKRGREAKMAVWEMANKQSIEASLQQVSIEKIDIPIEKIGDLAAGKIDAGGAGLTQAEAQQALDAYAAMSADSRKESIQIERRKLAPSESIKLSEAEGIFITMLARQQQYAEALERAGWDKVALDGVAEQLSDAGKSLLNFMADEYRTGYEPLARVFRNMFGVDLPQIQNYAPAAFYHQGDEKVRGPLESVPEGGFRANFLKTRKTHRAIPRLENAFATFLGHSAQSAHWQSHAELVRELRGVFGNPDVKIAMESRFGRDSVALINSRIQSLEGNGISKAHGALDSVANWLLEAQAFVSLAWSALTVLKEVTASWNSAYEVGLSRWFHSVGRLTVGRAETRLADMWNDPMIQRRIDSGFAPEARAIMDGAFTAKPTKRRAFLERGMELLGTADATFNAVSVAVAYDVAYQDAKTSGLGDNAAHAVATEAADRILDRTAQPADEANRSLFELRLNAWGKMMFMFASEPRQKTALWMRSMGRLLTGKATSKDIAVFSAHVMTGVFLTTLGAIWKDWRNDDDEWNEELGWLGFIDKDNWNKWDFLRGIALGPISGLPLINEFINPYPSSTPLSRFKKAGEASVQMMEGPSETEMETTEWYADRVTKVLQGTTPTAGVIARDAKILFDMVDNAHDDTIETGVKRLKHQADERKAQRPEPPKGAARARREARVRAAGEN